MNTRGVSTERFKNIRYYIRKLNIKSTSHAHRIIHFNFIKKRSTDSKLSTNTYLMSVATVFRKLYVKVDVTKLYLIMYQPEVAVLLCSGYTTEK